MSSHDLPAASGDFCRTVYSVARAVNSSLDVMQVLDMVVAGTAGAIGARACSLRLLGPDVVHISCLAPHTA